MNLLIINRYIAMEILASWLSVLLVLLLVVTSTETVHLLAWIADGRITVDALLPLLFNSLLEFAVLLIPLSLLLGVLLAFGRLYKDSEMTAVMAAGLGPLQWYKPLMMVAVPVSVLMLVLMAFVMPSISEHRDELLASSKNRADLKSLMAGRFNESSKGDAVFFIESLNESGEVMNHVFHQQSRQTENHIDIANTAVNTLIDERNYMVMQAGNHYIGVPGQADFRVIEYSEYGIYVPDAPTPDVRRSIKSLPTEQLWNSNLANHRGELQWRFTVPVATLIIAMLALPLSHTTPRSGRYAKLALAILVYLVYSNLLGVGKTWIVQQRIPEWLGTWWVHALALMLLATLLYQSGQGFRKAKSKTQTSSV